VTTSNHPPESGYGHTGRLLLRASIWGVAAIGLLGLLSATLDLGGAHGADLTQRQGRATVAVVAFLIALALDHTRRRIRA